MNATDKKVSLIRIGVWNYGVGATDSGVQAAMHVPWAREHARQAAGTPWNQPDQVTGAVTPAVTPTKPRQVP